MLRDCRFFHLVLAALMASPIVTGTVHASDPSSRPEDLFEIHVRPTLVAHCIQCHGESKQESGLRLTTIQELLQGGDSGPAIVPGKPEESLLLEAMRYESFEMPPAGELDSSVTDGIEAWIRGGAYWPQDLVLKPTPKISSDDREWWCYQPIANPPLPQVEGQEWCRNEIDHFVLAKLNGASLSPSDEADPAQLARRVHFTLTGLPPSPELAAEIEAGLDYETLVDRLLAETAYGENQARFWLDLVRYADSDGYNADHSRPDAYHYRDYVIRSFNEDKPYDRFIMEQLAGDEIDPGNRDALIATMYLRHWIYEWNQRDVEGQWNEILSDITVTTSDVFIAQGLKCARCHDHKFDPLLQKDYYRMQAFFTPIQPREDLPIADVETRSEYFEKQKKWEAATDEIRARLHKIEMPVLMKHATREGVDKFVKEIQDMIGTREDKRGPYEQQIASMAARQFDLHPEKLDEWLTDEQKAEREKLLAELASFDDIKPEPLPTLKFVASDVGPVSPPTYIPDVADPTDIAPGFPTILQEDPAEVIPPPTSLQSTGRRTALAKWLVDRQNPLTARVIVNRIWQQHFGRGLVETSSDFGRLGTPPSHPELLDWLATRFMADGWSLKKLHRLILTSATYRQSSQRQMDEQLRKVDPENLLLWRMNPRRLSGEEIHDVILSACEELGEKDRAIYKTVKRNRLDPLLASFDFPDRVDSECKRHRTTTSPQALLLMNSAWLYERATSLSTRLRGVDLDEMLETVYRRLYFRSPTAEELAMAAEFHSSYRTVTPDVEAPDCLEPLKEGLLGIDMNPEKPTTVEVPAFDSLPQGDFTVEAVVLLRSLYPDASVRTIATSWTGSQKDSGWALGVTSTKSGYKPRNLILQLVGDRGTGSPEYEVIPSNLHLELNRPYYVAVSVDLDDTSEQGITFVMKDLSIENAEPQIAHVAHHAKQDAQTKRPVEFGGRAKRQLWDGLIHRVRMHDAALSEENLDGTHSDNLLFDIQFADRKQIGRDASPARRDAVVHLPSGPLVNPAQRADIAVLHALLNSSEMIYVD